MKMLQILKTAPYRSAAQSYIKAIKRPMDEWQYDDWEFVNQHNECCICRSRGGSKTRDFVDWLILHVLMTEERWAWLASKTGQLDEAIHYCEKNKFVKKVRRIINGKYEVLLYNQNSIRFGIVSNSNLGLRFDGIVFDEEQNLEAAQAEFIFPQMKGMITHSLVHQIIHIGTLWIATKFNDYTHQFPTSIRPWDHIPHLVKAGFIKKEIDEGITPKWELDLLYNCIETMPSGLVFPNVIETTLTPATMAAERYGIDFGSDDHLVGVYIKDPDCYILHEQIGDTERFPECFDIALGQAVEVESGGYNTNDRYGAKDLVMSDRLNGTKQPVTQKWKSERTMAARRMNIYVDKNLTPLTYKDLKSASYGKDGLYLKDQLHPCHWLDAFFHAIGAVKHRYLPSNRRVESQVLKLEKLRDKGVR